MVVWEIFLVNLTIKALVSACSLPLIYLSPDRDWSGDEDVFGHEVNLASKLGEDNATAGEILVTETTIMSGRGRLTLIANEVARLAGTILVDYAAAVRKIKDTKIQPDATADATQQLQRLVPKRFLADTPWPRLQHLPRYLKAIVLRLD